MRQSLGLVALLAVGGCATWQTQQGELSQLPPAHMSPDSVAIEIAFIHAGPTDQQTWQSLWEEVDEQSLSTELRRRLAENGFRCGLVGSRLPEPLRRLLDAEENRPLGNAEAGVPVDREVTVRNRRLQSRAGRRNEIVASSSRDEMVVLERVGGKVCGRRYKQARCILALKTYPQGDGRVRLELTPEIQYGPVSGKWVGQEGMGIRWLHAGQKKRVFQQLRTELMLLPGQTMLLTCTEDVKGLGQCFFTESSGDSPSRKLLLVRLAQTQYDDLFDAGPVHAVVPQSTN